MPKPPNAQKTLWTLTLGALCGVSSLALVAAGPTQASAQREARVAPVTELPPIDVGGHAHGPGAFYMLERTRGTEATPELRRTFVREIVESVRNEPF